MTKKEAYCMNRTKPDDRRDNVEKLQEMIDDTIQNIEETESYLQAHGDEISEEQKQQLLAKNKRRQESLEGFRDEIKDEAQHQQQ